MIGIESESKDQKSRTLVRDPNFQIPPVRLGREVQTLPDEGQPARVVVKRIRKIRPEGEAEGVVVRVQVERVLGRLILIGGEVETRGVEIGSYIN